MLLVEADGKALLAEAGIAVPPGQETGIGVPVLPGPGPWVVKAQVPVGGRGKAGGIRLCASPAAVAEAAGALLASRLAGHLVASVLVEQAVLGAEHYLSLAVDPAGFGLRILHLAHGGVDVERHGPATPGLLCPPEPASLDAALAAVLPEHKPLRDLAARLGRLLLERELLLAEINPLFVTPTACIAGDAKLVVDLNAIARQPRLRRLIEARPDAYPDALRKLEHGFDYVEIDPEGRIGLLTTGAGLSMMLIDELVARGGRPLNFLDIRTGQLRGSPARIVQALAWMAERPSLRVVLVNIFAGITDLGEFAGLLADALEQAALPVKVIARLVGRGQGEAVRILAERRPGLLVTEDLEQALAATLEWAA